MHDSISSADLAAADASEARRRADDLTKRVEWLEGVIRAAGIHVDDVAVKAAMSEIEAERQAARKAEFEKTWAKRPSILDAYRKNYPFGRFGAR